MIKKPYRQELEEQLVSARERIRQGREAKNLKDNSKVLYEIIDLEISLLVNEMAGGTPLDRDTYLDVHGQLKGIRRIRDLLESKIVELPSVEQTAEATQNQLESLKK